MKKINLMLLIATTLFSVSFTSLAHDPKEHMKKPEKANCAAFDKMKKEDGKMDKTDPVMIAMMKKCDKQAKKMNHEANADGKKLEENKSDKNMKHKMMVHKKTKKDDMKEHH
jgi:hypothetical protein